MSEEAGVLVLGLLFVASALAGGFGYFAGKDAQRKEEKK